MATLAIDRYILDTLMRDLVGHDRRAASYLVYLTILNAAHDGFTTLSHQQIADRSGLAKRTVQDAILHLASRQLLVVKKRSRTEPAKLRLLTPWMR